MLKELRINLTGVAESDWPAMSSEDRDSLRALVELIASDTAYVQFAPVYAMTIDWPEDEAHELPTEPIRTLRGLVTVSDPA